jgi:hypothetical protein
MNDNMNNIVNELIEQADKWSCEEYNYKKTGYTREQLYSQKLAELIVLECIKMVENEAAQYAAPTWAVELVNDIKENFGVENTWEGWIGTHSPECWTFGPRHYECAIRRIKELEK